MDGLSRTDEVLALLNKRERGDVSAPTEARNEEPLGFADYLPTPAAAILHSLQRVSIQRQSEAAAAAPTVRTPEQALKVVLGEQRDDSSRNLRSVSRQRIQPLVHDSPSLCCLASACPGYISGCCLSAQLLQ